MIVMKFGGTSLEDAASVARVASIVGDRRSRHPVVVVSAMGKTTRKLLEAARASAAGDRAITVAIVADLRQRHLDEARELLGEPDGRAMLDLIDRYFEELRTLLEGLAILSEVPPRGLDKILAYGELLSSVIVAGAFQSRGITSRLLDSREFIRTDDRYGRAAPIVPLLETLVPQHLAPVLAAGEVPIIQGFIGSTRAGATTTLGFEGSDYTATLVGAALGADDIQIWKDVPGLMTADPQVYAEASTVKCCTFAEAGELTYFGAKVLHPKAIHPAAARNIAVHIYNSRDPAAIGTEIAAVAPPCRNAIKSIAHKRPISIIRLAAGEGLAGTSPHDEFTRLALDTLSRRLIKPYLTAISGANLAVAVDSQAVENGNADLADELGAFGRVRIEDRKAIISVVGDGLRESANVRPRIWGALDSLDVDLVLHGSSAIAINLVTRDEDVDTIVSRLHRTFFGELDPVIFAAPRRVPAD
ncbi:MAG: aspartate kinase [Acidobacteria bacterium]|nr:aspartate kinase [Acidobacteriota bacterium]